MKRLFLFIAIAAIIGIGIFVLQPYRNKSTEVQPDPTSNAEIPAETVLEPTEETIRSLIPHIIGSQFNAQTAKYTLVNIDNKNGYELIIGAIENVQDPWSRPIQATIQVVTLQNTPAQYDRIGGVTYKEWMRGVPEVKELKDVTGNNQPEIIASLMYGGASSSAEGILRVNISAKNVQWLNIQNEQGQIQDAIFQIGGSSGHWNTVQFKNIDNSPQEELIEIFAQVVPFQDQQIECEVYVYMWSGSQFVYSADLSAQALSQLDENCQL